MEKLAARSLTEVICAAATRTELAAIADSEATVRAKQRKRVGVTRFWWLRLKLVGGVMRV